LIGIKVTPEFCNNRAFWGLDSSGLVVTDEVVHAFRAGAPEAQARRVLPQALAHEN
jgi:hypothetical protein